MNKMEKESRYESSSDWHDGVRHKMIPLSSMDEISAMLEVKEDNSRSKTKKKKIQDIISLLQSTEEDLPSTDEYLPSTEEDLPSTEECDISAEDLRTQKIKDHVDDLIDNSSLHGLVYIFDSRHSIRRIIWFVITVSAFCYSMLKVYESTMNFFDYPFNTSIRREYVAEMQFPAVSFCNLNDMRLSVLEGTMVDKAILDHRYTANVTSAEYRNVTRSATHRLDEMLVECIFDGQPCSADNFTEFDWMQGDRCFTFNSGAKGHEVLYVNGTGLHRSLLLTINIQHYDYYRDSDVSGIHLILHGHDETPVRIRGPMIPPGFTTYIQVEKKKTLNLESPYKTHCGSLKLKYFKGYSMHTCWLEQLTDYVEYYCGCKDFFMPGNMPICNLTHAYNCMWPRWDEFDKQKKYECPLPCEIDSYHSNSMSRALFPSASYAEHLMEEMKDLPHMREVLNNVSDVKQFMRENILRVMIFYENLSFEQREQQPSYDTQTWLGDIGGQIGLFIGAGAMSYFEFVDCLALVIYTKFFERFSANGED